MTSASSDHDDDGRCWVPVRGRAPVPGWVPVRATRHQAPGPLRRRPRHDVTTSRRHDSRRRRRRRRFVHLYVAKRRRWLLAVGSMRVSGWSSLKQLYFLRVSERPQHPCGWRNAIPLAVACATGRRRRQRRRYPLTPVSCVARRHCQRPTCVCWRVETATALACWRCYAPRDKKSRSNMPCSSASCISASGPFTRTCRWSSPGQNHAKPCSTRSGSL